MAEKARDPPSLLKRKVTGGSVTASARSLDLRVLQVDGVILALGFRYLVRQTLAHFGRCLAVPSNRTSFEADMRAGALRLYEAKALGFVKRLDGAKIFHVEVLLGRGWPELAAPRLRGAKDGKRRAYRAKDRRYRLVATPTWDGCPKLTRGKK